MWRKTSKKVLSTIYKQHQKDFIVFGTYTDVSGDEYYTSDGHSFVMTEWGFKGAKNPLIRAENTKENSYDKEWNYEYFIWSD